MKVTLVSQNRKDLKTPVVEVTKETLHKLLVTVSSVKLEELEEYARCFGLQYEYLGEEEVTFYSTEIELNDL